MYILLRRLILFIAFFGILIISCKKEISYENNSGGSTVSPNLITGAIKLLVLNEFGVGVNHAKIQTGNFTFYTNEFGLVEMKNILVVKNKALVKVNVDGYFEAYRTFSIDKNECFGKIKLQPYQMTGTVQSATGGIVNISNESSISFPPNAFVFASDGTNYNGEVSLFANYLNPNNPDFSILMQGNLVGEDNGDFILQSYGMLNIEIKSGAGLQLQLKSGVTAVLKAQIPSNLLSNSPPTIPMWYFNIERGIWIKEGNGNKEGNKYVAEVSHFTIWNYDVPRPLVYVSGKLTDSHGNPYVHTLVRTNANVYTVAEPVGYTNTEGYFRIAVPNNASCGISVTSEDCNIPFFTFPFTTTTTDIDLGTIITNTVSQNYFSVLGNSLNCNNQPVQSGNIKVYTQNNVFEGAINNGLFNILFPICKDSVDALIVIEDFTTNKFSTSTRRLYKGTVSNFGNINVCNTNNEYFIKYIVDDQMFYIIGEGNDSLSASYWNFSTPYLRISHANLYSTPNERISFHAGFYPTNPSNPQLVEYLNIDEFPNITLGNGMGVGYDVMSTPENYSGIPGSTLKGSVKGKIFDNNASRWRNLDILYSVKQQ